MFGPKRNKAFQWAKAAVNSLDLTGKKAAVVGGTDGLGRAIAKLASQQGAEVFVIGRTNRDPEAERITFAKSDLSLMREAKGLGEKVLPPDLDVLLFTNGIMAATKREVTLNLHQHATAFMQPIGAANCWAMAIMTSHVGQLYARLRPSGSQIEQLFTC